VHVDLLGGGHGFVPQQLLNCLVWNPGHL
jgi:hypothetical protein